MKIGCLGPSGSYSELAAVKLSPSAKVVLFRNFPTVVNALKTGEVDEIALPIENTIQGGVLQNMDLLSTRSTKRLPQIWTKGSLLHHAL